MKIVDENGLNNRINKSLFLLLLLVFVVGYALLYIGGFLFDKSIVYSGLGANVDDFDKEVIYYSWNILTYISIFIYGVIFLFIATYKLGNLDRKYQILIVLVFSLVPRIIQLGDLPFYDSDYYLQAFNKLAGSFSIKNMSFWNHPTYAYAFIYCGTFKIFENPLIGIQCINIVLSEIAVLMVWDIFSFFFKQSSELNVIGTCLFSVAPMFLGLTSSISPDYVLGIFTVFLYWALIKQKKIWFLFFSLCLCFTKEVGIVILAGIILGFFIYLVVNKQCIIKNYYILSTVSLVIVIGCTYIYMSIKGMTWGGNVADSLTFNIDYIWLKIKSVCALNFYYILWFLTVLLLINLIKQKAVIQHYILLFPVLSGFICYFGFFCVYRTFNNVRYHLPLELFLLLAFNILLLIKIENITDNKLYAHIIKYVSVVMLFVFVVQSFVTIDPVMKKFFPIINTGSIEMANTWLEAEDGITYSGAEYNHQYTYKNKIFDIVLSENGYNDNMDIVFYGNEFYQYICWIHGIDTIGYNEDIKKRVYLYQGDEGIKISPITFLGNCFAVIDEDDLKDEAIYIIFPDFDIDENISLIQLSEYYDIGNKVEVNIRGRGKAYYYHMWKKGLM